MSKRHARKHMKKMMKKQKDYAFYNRNDQLVSHQCENVTGYTPLPYGTYGLGTPIRCNRDSEIIEFYVTASGRHESIHLCARCASEWERKEK